MVHHVWHNATIHRVAASKVTILCTRGRDFDAIDCYDPRLRRQQRSCQLRNDTPERRVQKGQDEDRQADLD
jgi:hypothetical protein